MQQLAVVLVVVLVNASQAHAGRSEAAQEVGLATHRCCPCCCCAVATLPLTPLPRLIMPTRATTTM
jgi:hypothetical protein